MIRQFDVFDNPIKGARAERPYLIVLQHDLLGDLATRILAPLARQTSNHLVARLNPSLMIGAQKLHLLPADLVTLPVNYLRDPIANLEFERARIVAALDLVFTGI